MKKVFTITILICMMLIASFAWSAIIPVPTPEYPTIQDGIDAAVDGDTVLVADGTYTGDGNKNLDFNGKAITVESENGAENCIIDCEGDGRGFYFHLGEYSTSRLNGFTIRNGSTGEYGGGIFFSWSHPRIANCIIIDNSAYRGGGIHCDNSSPIIENCSISNNSASYGGGIECSYSSPLISDSIVSNNSAGSTGAVNLAHSSSPEISFCRITNNMGGGPGITIYYQSSPVISNSLISDNSGDGCQFTNSSYPDFINCLISNNSGDGLWTSTGAGADITNCTIAYNAGDGVYTQGSSVVIKNSILYGNNEFQIYVWSPPLPQISYSDVEDKDSGGVHGGVDWGPGNIDADPLFVDPDIFSDYHLQVGSPCIDAGTPDGAPDDDLDGNPRDEYPDMGAYEYQGISIRIISPADGAEFPMGDVVDVVAEVRDELDEPMVGVEVAFIATGGTVEPTTVFTDVNGQAVTQLTVAEGENIVTATLTNYPGISDTVTVIGLALIGSINGHVIDFRGFPLGALVIAIKKPIKEKTLTESPTGYYEIPNLEPGNYWVICIKKGYKTGIKQVEVEAGQVTTCNFVLRRKVE